MNGSNKYNIIAFTFILSIIFMVISSNSIAQSYIDGSNININERDAKLMEAAAIMKSQDPYSIIFKNINYTSDDHKNKYDIICGYINSKNEYGGYGGFEAFSYGISSNTFSIYSKNDLYDSILGPLTRMAFRFSGCPDVIGYKLLIND